MTRRWVTFNLIILFGIAVGLFVRGGVIGVLVGAAPAFVVALLVSRPWELGGIEQPPELPTNDPWPLDVRCPQCGARTGFFCDARTESNHGGRYEASPGAHAAKRAKLAREPIE